MARGDVSQLYKALMGSRFTFMPRGTQLIRHIYEKVKQEFLQLCDDGYGCMDNCTSTQPSPNGNTPSERPYMMLPRPVVL